MKRCNGALNKNTLTRIEHAEDSGFLAPHHYCVLEEKTGNILADIWFQSGPVKEAGLNGITNEDLLDIVLNRIMCFQKSKSASRENEMAIQKLEECMMWLNKRAKEQSFT